MRVEIGNVTEINFFKEVNEMTVYWLVCLKLSVYMSKSKKVRMNYSSHGIYGGNHMVFSLFSLLNS